MLKDRVLIQLVMNQAASMPQLYAGVLGEETKKYI